MEIATVSGQRTVRSYFLIFLGALGLTFLSLAVAIFVLIKPLVTVRSIVEIGFVFVQTRESNIEEPEAVVRLITAKYAPEALSAMVNKGVPAAVTNALATSTAENAGRSVMIVSTIDPAAENQAKEFQQKIIDQILQEETKRAQLVRERLRSRIGVTEKAVANLRQEADALVRTADDVDNVLADAKARKDELTGTSERTRGNSAPPAPSPDGLGHTSTRTIEDLTLERAKLAQHLVRTRHQLDDRTRNIARARYSLESIREAIVSQQPQLVSGSPNAQRLNLLFVALVTSILLAIGAIALVRELDGTKSRAAAASDPSHRAEAAS